MSEFASEPSDSAASPRSAEERGADNAFPPATRDEAGRAGRYRERLTVPVIWWVLAVLLALSAGVAVGFYLGPGLGVAVGLLAMVIAATLLAAASTLITVESDRLTVGRAMIEFDYVGAVRALDEAATARRFGPEADARAYLVLRPYVKTAVEVTVADPADPVPYWLISTRRPQHLAAALSPS